MTITLSEELAETLRDRKGPEESYEDVIRRLVEGSESATGGPHPEGVAGRPDPAIETGDETTRLVNEVAVDVLPDARASAERRREALQAAVEYLRQQERADRSDFVRDVYPKHPVGYGDDPDPERSWWDEAVSEGLAAIADRSGAVERAGDDEWRYVGGVDE